MLVDNKKIYIKVRVLNSAYGHANKDRLAEVIVNKTIGSSITSVNKMLANPEEQAAIMKDIISISPNSAEWNKSLANYWNSFTFEVPEYGKELEVGFVYDINSMTKREYIQAINKGMTKESDKLTTDKDLLEYIDSRIKDVNLKFNEAIKASKLIKNEQARNKAQDLAYKIKYDSIIAIEGDRFKVGTPIDAFEYMLYRHCLVYGDVANEKNLVHKSQRIRFYLHSKEDIKKEKKQNQTVERNRITALLKVTDSADSVKTMLYALGEGDRITSEDVDNYDLVTKLSKSRPNDFLRIANDKNLSIIGRIEMYIANGILTRHPGSNSIYLSTDLKEPIGNNMEEAISYFTNKVNEATVSELKLKFKNLAN